MTNLEITISINRLSEYRESLKYKISDEDLLKIIESFSLHVAKLYLCLIEEAINSRRYKGQWEPIDEEGYLDFLGVTPEVDILSLIQDALEIKRIGYRILIRISPRYRYPDTNIPLIKVLRAIENGTSDFHARPILVKCTRDIQKNLKRLWSGYLAMKGVV